MDWSLSKVTRLESGGGISPNDLSVLLAYLGVTDVDEVRRLVQTAKLFRSRQVWWSDPKYRTSLATGTRRLIQFEAEATAIRQFGITLVPGLLQTGDYARAVLQSYESLLDDRDVDVILGARLRRQEVVLSRHPAPCYLVVLDESVLHRIVGDSTVMGGQLDALVRWQRSGRVAVRTTPFVTVRPSVPPCRFLSLLSISMRAVHCCIANQILRIGQMRMMRS